MSCPDPLSPPGCDLTSHTYFPLHYDRLLRSKWWRRASDLARSRNMDLWAHAFREIPAASLPNDDADLADMAGFGRDIAAFLKVKREILEPWVLCSDGRYYHPTLSEVAGELWERMDGKRRANRERQSARRERIKSASVTQKSDAVTRDATTPSRVTPPPVTLQNAIVTRISGPKERKGDLDANASVASAGRTATESEPWKADTTFQALWRAAPDKMRRRCHQAEVWDELRKQLRRVDGAIIVLGFARYLEGDPDVARTGGPGLQRWLKGRVWERWIDDGPIGADWPDTRWAAAIEIWRESGRWDVAIGPEPGQPGCRAPTHLLIQSASATGA